MIDARYRLIVVTPVYEDVEASARLFIELKARFGRDIFLVAVDDGSIREPLELNSMESARIDGVILKLRRNVGHQRAIAIGLGYVAESIDQEQRVVVMDSDGEDMPATIPALLNHLQGEDVDVVVARRGKRIETPQFKIFYSFYKLLFGLMTGRAISFGNFMALKARALKRLVAMQELSIHVAGAVLASKLRMRVCQIDRGARYAGESKMNFARLALHGFKAIMIFAEDALARVGIACSLVATLSVVFALIAVVLKLIGFSTPGWFSVALGILVLIFLQTGMLGLMTLMLAGVARSGAVTPPRRAYHDFVERIIHAPTPNSS